MHFVSTRHRGASAAPYASLNLSFRVGDERAHIVENRRRLLEGLGIGLDALTTCQQVHETHVEIVTAAQRGRGAQDYESALAATDAVVTNQPGICLLIMAADCVPVLVHDPRRGAIGLAHAGWRGTVARVAQHMVRTMINTYSCAAEDLHAAIGPSIGPEDYEVGDEVLEAVRTASPETWEQQVRWSAKGRPHFDLWAANRLQLLELGIPDGQIELAAISTFQAADAFFSERRDGRPTGRFAAGLMLRG